MDRDFVSARLTSSQFDCEHLQLRALAGREAISQPYRFELEVVCTDPGELLEAEVVGAEATLVFEQGGLEVRSLHGMISQLDDLLDSETAFRTYRLELVPRAFRLSMIETQEIFLDQTVPDIVKAKLELVGLGGADVEQRLVGTYEPREFVVEYRETDLAFVSRLTEHLGVSYFFEHGDGFDKLVFTDHAAGFRPIEGEAKVGFRARGEAREVYRLEKRSRLFPAAFVVQDYNYRTPQVDLTTSHEAKAGHAGGVVEYGGHHKTPDAGRALAKARAEEAEARHRFFVGEADVCRFSAGATFELVDHPRLGDAKLLLVEVEHHLTQAVMSAAGSGKEAGYRATFKAVDATKPYRPPIVTPKPRIHGVLTGRVEAEPEEAPGKVARIDEQGRYTVRFFFDTASFTRTKCSRPIRMLQPHAGPNYGMHFPLKPGVEVLVTFLDGDPDRPLIAGSVPNPLNPSPVNRRNAVTNRLETASGITLSMKDVG